MKRTMLVTLDFPPMIGGVASYWANLARLMPSDRFFVLAEEGDSSLDFDVNQSFLIYRQNLISCRRWLWPRWLPLLWAMYRLARMKQIQRFIVAHVLPTGTAALILKKILRIPYNVSIHGLDVAWAQRSKRKKWLTKIIFKNAESVIVNSDFTRQRLQSLCHIAPGKIHLVYPCPNVVAAPAEVSREEFLKKYNLENKRFILTVGRLIERKGQDKVIEALPRIMRAVPAVAYLVVGRGPKLDSLRASVKELKLEKQVRFCTDILDSELPAFYQNSELFIMPSRQLEDGDVEGFGIVYLEANHYGLPVIAGRSGGASEAVEHGINGLLVDPLSVNDIAQAIMSLLTNQVRACEFGERGRRRVAERFTWSEQARELVKALE